MEFSEDFLTYASWTGIATTFFLVVAVIGFVFNWGIRFRLIGISGFFAVVTGGLIALSVGFFTKTVLPGSVPFSLVYDNGAGSAVIAVAPDVSEDAIEPTLRQAAQNLFSYGRDGLNSQGKLTIRIRTVIHPVEGITQPIYLGKATRSLVRRSDEQFEIEIFADNFLQLTSARMADQA